MVGKKIRIQRLLGEDGRTVIIPIDHGVTSGPLRGLEGLSDVIAELSRGKPRALLLHKGAVMQDLWQPTCDCGLIVHLSAGTELSGSPERKTLVCEVEEAVRLGADGVSVHISLGTEWDTSALDHLASVSRRAAEWGVPLLAMMYVYGAEAAAKQKALAHAARVAAELGADLVKVSYHGDPVAFAELVRDCFAPVVVAGGPAVGDGLEMLEAVECAMAAGAAGACIGRNVHQHPRPSAVVRCLNAVVHEGLGAREAYENLLQPLMVSAGREPTASGVGTAR